jgi:hypothetical protein
MLALPHVGFQHFFSLSVVQIQVLGELTGVLLLYVWTTALPSRLGQQRAGWAHECIKHVRKVWIFRTPRNMICTLTCSGLCALGMIVQQKCAVALLAATISAA